MNKVPEPLQNAVPEYAESSKIREAYEEQLQTWIAIGWLIPYPPGTIKTPQGPDPSDDCCTAQQTQNTSGLRLPRIRPLRGCLSCASKLPEWRQQGVNVTLLPLRKVYLEIGAHELLWPFQKVIIKGKLYCLTHVGFVHNVAPLIMKVIVKVILSQEEVKMRANSSYIDDIMKICLRIRSMRNQNPSG